MTGTKKSRTVRLSADLMNVLEKTSKNEIWPNFWAKPTYP
jgi:hypothetical protein